MEREQIIKALECCSVPKLTKCNGCPRECEDSLCMYRLSKDAIALIKQLTEENTKLQVDFNELYEENESLRDTLKMYRKYNKALKAERADTVREFAERLKQYIDVGHYRPPTEICFSELDVANIIDKIKKEMLEGAK